MEIIHHLTADQDPAKIARAAESASATLRMVTGRRRRQADGDGDGLSLKQRLQAERSGRGLANQSRHTHFGGVLRVEQSTWESSKQGSKQGTFVSNPFQAAQGGDSRQGPAQRRDRSKLVFNATGPMHKAGGAADRGAEEALGHFCWAFLRESYRPFIMSLKTEFRLETARLLSKDKQVLMRITRFFLALRRHSRKFEPPPVPGAKSSAETVDFPVVAASMDIYSFKFVFRSIDESVGEKKWRDLETATELLLEMTQLLWWGSFVVLCICGHRRLAL